MDSRFELKVQFHIYGQDFPWRCSLNWHAENGEIDRRITEFFLNAHDKAYEQFLDRVEACAEKEEADAERKEYERLRQKYE